MLAQLCSFLFFDAFLPSSIFVLETYHTKGFHHPSVRRPLSHLILHFQLRKSFARILIALAVFDITFIAASGMIFSLRY